MSILSRLFGGKTPEPATEAVSEHNGFRIYPNPAKESGGYRIGARIEKVIDGETKVHHLIRADTIAAMDEAVDASVSKAIQVIDEQGDRLFR